MADKPKLSASPYELAILEALLSIAAQLLAINEKLGVGNKVDVTGSVKVLK
jgi:hypothetical protein